VGVSAGWSGFTQQFTNIDPVIDETLQDEISSANANIAACEQQNDVFARLANPLPPQDCSALAFTPAQQVELAGLIREGNSLFPLSFTAQPFQVQLFVSLPVFNGFQRELQIAQAQAFADDAELALRDRRLGLQAEITERFHDVGRARRTIEIQAENEAAGQDQLELGRERYRLGQGSFFELLEAQLTAHQAERDHLNAIYEYHRAVTRLDAAVGRAVR
jgi:outer membrane protein